MYLLPLQVLLDIQKCLRHNTFPLLKGEKNHVWIWKLLFIVMKTFHRPVPKKCEELDSWTFFSNACILTYEATILKEHSFLNFRPWDSRVTGGLNAQRIKVSFPQIFFCAKCICVFVPVLLPAIHLSLGAGSVNGDTDRILHVAVTFLFAWKSDIWTC